MDGRDGPLRGGEGSDTVDLMSNVVPLTPRGRKPGGLTSPSVREAAALSMDLAGLVEEIRAAAIRAADLGQPAPQVERTVQSLLDAVTAVERAFDLLIEDDPQG